jgi:hypothetical protein
MSEAATSSDRLIAAEELGALDKETAQSLREAFALSPRSAD